MTADVRARYEQAHTLIQGILTKRVALNDAVFPHWIADSSCFWYRRETREGREFRLVDAAAATNVPAFDHKVLADALADAAGTPVKHDNLPIRNLTLTLSPRTVRFQGLKKHWQFDAADGRCHEQAALPEGLISPDGTKVAFIREHNLWVRGLATGEERAVTQDGTEDYCYARAQWNPMTVQAQWSPDSNHLLAVRLDLRGVTPRDYIHYVPQDGTLRPQLAQHRYARCGDDVIETNRLFVIDVRTGQAVAAEFDALPMIFGGLWRGFFDDNPMGWWAADSQRAYFVEIARGAKAVRLVELTPNTGATRVLFEETSDTFINVSHGGVDDFLALPLPESNELIWCSERTGWAHLYLYDLSTGALKNVITKGNWLVRDILRFDAASRELLIQTGGRHEAISPYYRDICRVNVDSGTLVPVATERFEHSVYRPHTFAVRQRNALGFCNADAHGVSPCGRYLVITRSRVDTVPVTTLIDRNGQELLELETADVHGLPKDWVWPEPVKVKSADGHTDIHGVVFRPPGFDPKQSYPVLDYSLNQRDFAAVPQGSFINEPIFGAGYLMAAAHAALGFVVVAINGRGTPCRDKAFHTYKYGDFSAASDLDDRVAGIRQLAERYPCMDLDRVGITGIDNHSNSVYGLLDHPDFYKLAILFHLMDPRDTPAGDGEVYEGVSLDKAAASRARYTEDLVSSLKGKLFLIQGMLDPSTTTSTFRLAEALQKANKDFDFLGLPCLDHNMSSYALRLSWDYLVRNLQGAEPPSGIQVTVGTELAMMTALAEGALVIPGS